MSNKIIDLSDELSSLKDRKQYKMSRLLTLISRKRATKGNKKRLSELLAKRGISTDPMDLPNQGDAEVIVSPPVVYKNIVKEPVEVKLSLTGREYDELKTLVKIAKDFERFVE